MPHYQTNRPVPSLKLALSCTGQQGHVLPLAGWTTSLPSYLIPKQGKKITLRERERERENERMRETEYERKRQRE